MYFYDGCFTLSKKTLEVIKETKNDAVIQLKGNQKTLATLVEIISNNNTPLTTFEQKVNKGHGRIDSRKTEVFEIPELSKALDSEWNNISCFAKTYRTRKVMNTEKRVITKPKQAFLIILLQKY